MRILIVRHGDPDYSIDGLTEKGKLEAKLLSERLVKEDMTEILCSTLGRAKLTIKPTLDRLGREAEYCSWLREFDYAKVKLPYVDHEKCCWDLLPSFAENYPEIYLPDRWTEVPFIKESGVAKAYGDVCRELDAAILRHGYRKDGAYYKVERESHDTLVLVCHFGLLSVLLSHLLHVSPYSSWQHLVTAPTSVTTLYTEERESGIAHFRCASIGDISHLYIAGEEPAFAARFCECFSDDTRHH